MKIIKKYRSNFSCIQEQIQVFFLRDARPINIGRRLTLKTARLHLSVYKQNNYVY